MRPRPRRTHGPRLPLSARLLGLPPTLLLFFFPPAPSRVPPAPVQQSATEAGALSLRVAPVTRVRVPVGSLRAGSTARELVGATSLCATHTTPEVRVLCQAMLQLERTPPRRVRLSAFDLDRVEVTQEAYARCVRAGACTPSHDGPAALRGPNLPVVAVDHVQARAYCAFAGGSLPTEAQWERAARGEGRARFPWGEVFNASLANHGRLRAGAAGGIAERAEDDEDGYSALAPVGSFPAGASPFGALDMAGNVREWVDDALLPNPSEEPWHTPVDPRGPREGEVFVVRGGGYLSASFELRVSHRWAEPGDRFAEDLGFRCAYPPSR